MWWQWFINGGQRQFFFASGIIICFGACANAHVLIICSKFSRFFVLCSKLESLFVFDNEFKRRFVRVELQSHLVPWKRYPD